ncbi:hypothetical protein GG344DRAFT_64382 [Lentinula edodes]|nr:hypothetical protein GG344DRAFT_64382 [Lentinula edodes]
MALLSIVFAVFETWLEMSMVEGGRLKSKNPELGIKIEQALNQQSEAFFCNIPKREMFTSDPSFMTEIRGSPNFDRISGTDGPCLVLTSFIQYYVSSIFSTAPYLLANASDLNSHKQGKEDKIKRSHRTGLMVVIKRNLLEMHPSVQPKNRSRWIVRHLVQSTVGCHKRSLVVKVDAVYAFTRCGHVQQAQTGTSFSIQFTPAHFTSLQSNLIASSIPRSTSQSFVADHLHSTIASMRLNIAFFAVSFAAAAYALPITDVSNTNASVADGRAGAVLPRANSDGFFQSNSGPPEPSTSGPPRPSISSRGASETEKTSPKLLKYTFIAGKVNVRDGFDLEANQLTQELIRKHIPPGKAHPKLEPTNEYVGVLNEITFKVDMSTIKIQANLWTSGHIAQVEATWNGKPETYTAHHYDPDFVV